jgi:serine/threonine-protein kinase
MMLAVGSVFAGYRVQRVLGSGGMGTVYLARDPDLPRSDAVKVLSAELSRDPAFRARFVREADVAAGLDHPNIVAIRRRGEFEGQLWIAMQFVDGPDADAALRAGQMTPARAVRIVAEVAKALDYAHGRNVVHRDVKPANFLLSQELGADERVMLADFGIARALDDAAGLTGSGVVLATVGYAAPEVLAGTAFDGRADLYSLGCALFRMLTGKPPFSAAGGPAAVMMAHLQAPPPKVTDAVPALPVGLDRVIATAMAKDPLRRFDSARQLAAAAAEALADRRAATTAPWPPIPPTEVISYPQTPAGGPSPWWQPSGPPTQMSPTGPGLHLGAVAPGISPPLQPKPRRRWRIALFAAAAILTAAAITITTITVATHTTNTATTSTTTPPPAPAPTVAIADLKALLVSADQISTVMGGSAMTAEPLQENMFDDAANISERDCVGTWLPAQAAAYTGSGWDAVEAQKLRAPDGQVWQHGAIQAVIGFPSLQSAEKFLSAQSAAWKTCAGKRFTVTPPGSPAQQWTFGQFSAVDAASSIPITMDGFAGSCQRAITARGNVVIDVAACQSEVANQAGTIVHDIAAKIT